MPARRRRRRTSSSRSWSLRSSSSSGRGPASFERRLSKDCEPTSRHVRSCARVAKSTEVEVQIEQRTLKLTNLDKVLYPEAGFTKGQVIDYYTRMAPVLLPHTRDHPLTLKRYPNGVDAEFFYEKNCPKHRPPWVETATVWSGGNNRDMYYCLCQDLPTLVWLAQIATLEFHTSLSLASNLPEPRTLVFDLDPGPPATIVVHKQLKELRTGRVLIDWSQNDEYKTTVNVYSLRARARPTVSTPVSWAEVEKCYKAGDPRLLVFDSEQVLARVAKQGDLFEPVIKKKQKLPKSLVDATGGADALDKMANRRHGGGRSGRPPVS